MNLPELLAGVASVCEDHRHPADVRKVFAQLSRDPALMSRIDPCTNELQSRGLDLLYDLIAMHYWQAGKALAPVFRCELPPDIFRTDVPRLCLGLHARYSPLTAVLLSRSCPFVILSDFPGAVRKIAAQSGIVSGQIKLIGRDEKCLLHIRQQLARNVLVSSTIDFRRSNPGPFDLLSDTLLKVALKLQPVTCFGLHRVAPDGSIVYTARRLNLDQDLSGLKSDVMAFIAGIRKGASYEFARFDYEEQTRRARALMST